MPRSAGVSVENSFVNGLVTQATAFNFPENAVTDCDNVVFDERGIVSRRLGIDYEEDHQTSAIARTSSYAISQYVWRSAAGNGLYNFNVVQAGNTLYFYQIGSGALSSNLSVWTIDLGLYAVGLTQDTECQFASGFGKLFVVNKHMEPIVISYNPTTGAFSAQTIDIYIRDFEGVEDGYDVDERPATTTGLHSYNLWNQGWPSDKTAAFIVATGLYPSNADVWWLFKNAEDRFLLRTVASGGATQDIADNTLAMTQLRGNSPAPKGHVLLRAFYQDRDQYSGTGLPVVSAGTYRPSAVAFFAGRVFYSGVAAEGFNNKIYFTKIIEHDDEFGHCHQVNDPTSEFNFDLLPSDGGVIVIPEIGEVYRMVAMDASIVIFASNGIWTISGSEGTGFRANDYAVKKISSVSVLSSASFVDMGGVPSFWNEDGIYVVQRSQLGDLQLQSLTETKIRSFYEDIPAECKRFARGAYHPVKRVAHWVYRSTDPGTIDQRYEYDRVLVFNAISGAFYPFSFDTDTVKVLGITCVEGEGTITSSDPVLDVNGNTVTNSLGAIVTVSTTISETLNTVFKYYVATGANTTFAELGNGNYVDWESAVTGGIQYDSYFVTGYKVRGEGLRKYQANYVQFISEGQDPSTYYVQALWDWAANANTGRWSSRQKIEHNTTTYYANKRRVKLRGHGVALQMKISSFGSAPFDLLGWATFETANSTP